MKNLLIIILIPFVLFGQDTTRSKAFKTSIPISNGPLVKKKQGTYPLMAGFLLVKEANSGDPHAQHELGIRYLLGKGFEADTAKAVYWIQEAVKRGLVTANFNLGLMLNNETGVPWNPFEAYKLFKYAAEKGMPPSQYMIGLFLLDNLVVNRDYNEAYKWFKRASNGKFEAADEIIKELKKMNLVVEQDSLNEIVKSDASAFFDESLLMQNNWELDYYEFEEDSNDAEKSDQLFEELLNEENDKLKTVLGISSEKDSVELHNKSSIELVKYASEGGSPEALLIYGKSFQKGLMNEKNTLRAALNYVRAARLGSFKAATQLLEITKDSTFFESLKSEVDNNNPDAMYVWAGLVGLGFDYRIAGDQAFDLLEQAAKLNHVDAIIELGLTYYSGTLVEQNKEKAFEYWKRAAELGSTEAKVRIAFAEILEEKKYNYKSNIAELSEAAEKGSVLAQTAMGYVYENGVGVKQHKATAATYYRRASNRGNETAFNSLKNLYDEIRPTDPEFQIFEN
ncbi:MAG: sel1 repeat family protein [Melioribacteraceae bacterium]|nr:sel1 repeat family protein [Melioribacteraceae bacterium]MCF8263435.1 sel1 repeat family protein [Melioribacteraceae bacterium]MCF8414015.1 sel1 repeat family protein [Melioribacteraceae bacterium]MCF8430433.1 sel1 repeat family protein [Melioribacteraceae bacterium]